MFKFKKFPLKLLQLKRNKRTEKQFIGMKYLNVAEKNDAAKTISGLLSNGTAKRREGYSVYNKIFDFEAAVNGFKSKMIMTSVSGHLLNQEFLVPYRNWRNVDPQALFDAPVRKGCLDGNMAVKRTIEKEVRGCQGLIIWTDCDREGENIGFEIIEVCRGIKSNLKIYRAIFSEITRASVQRALQHLSHPDKRQSDAVDIRSELDLRTGAAITRFQTMRLQKLFPNKISDKLISYGSCQIPTLGFVVDRYKEVEAFVSEPFWKLRVIHTIDDLTVEFNWSRNRLFDKELCENYFLICLSDPKATVENVTIKPKSKWRPEPMNTVEMEKLGSRKLKLSAKETMIIAEKLYSKGIISYPRTETNQFSKDINLRSLVEQQVSHPAWGEFANKVIEWGPNPRNGNKSDQAHPPIHPTKLVTYLEGKEERLYELICRHFLACVSKDAKGSETTVNLNIGGEKFSANGLCINERNYLDVYIYDKWNSKLIHTYTKGQIFDPTDITMTEGTTTAPPLLTEADLIALMEKHGIGTDATHADHINTIKERGYIGVIDNGFLIPGIIGMGLCEAYNAMQLQLTKPDLRAEFESDLKKICLGEKNPQTVLKEYIVKYKNAYKQIIDHVTQMDEKFSERINEPLNVSNDRSDNANSSDGWSSILEEKDCNKLKELFKCPKCLVAPLALRQKKNQTGEFIGCLNYPDCKNAIWLPDEWEKVSVCDETCERCGSDVKLLELQLKSAYYKSLFNTPFGKYKTCLRCDEKLRNVFNINESNVKRLGAIVSDTSNEYSNDNTDTIVPNPSNRHAKNTKSSTQTNNVRKKKKELNSGDIRSLFTATGPSNSVSKESAQTVLDSTQLDVFFLNDDDFNEFIATSDNVNDVDRKKNKPSQNSTILDAKKHNLSRPLSANLNPGKKVIDLTTIFNDSFDNSCYDINLDDIAWGTANNKLKKINPSIKSEPSTSRNNGRQEVSQTVSVNCNKCHQPAKQNTVKKEGPNKGECFYSCSKEVPCKFFQWADAGIHSKRNTSNNRSNISGSVIVNCNCGVAASSFTVRKDGPNKGRPFYSCVNRHCDFFQWGDETENNLDNGGRHSSNMPVSSNTANLSRDHQTSNNNRLNKKRKCGLCRQDGHTRQKCPRKAEFEY